MSRHQHTGQPRQVLPAMTTPESSVRPSRTRSTPSSSITPLSTAESSSTSGLRASSFWVQEGMDTFFDWLTDPHNYARLQKKNPVAGQRQADLHKEICRLVNNKHKTSWTEAQVKSKITYAKSKYREAAGLNSTGEGPVLQKQEEICPLFVRLHTVLGGSLSVNPPPPRQTGDKRQREDATSSDDSEENSSNLEPLDEISDVASNADTTVSGRHDTTHPSKRRKRGALIPSELNSTIDKMHQLTDKQINASDRFKAELRARELAVANRECGLAEKLLRIADEANKRAEEARAQLRAELAAERAQLKVEMAAERAEIRQARDELKRDRDEVKRDKDEFMNERESLKTENAVLKRELQLRNNITK